MYEIKDNASIWYGAVLRGDTASVTIGRNTNIQDNCTIHVDVDLPAIIGKGVTIGHNAVVHGCTIADQCLIGMGAMVLFPNIDAPQLAFPTLIENILPVGVAGLVAAGLAFVFASDRQSAAGEGWYIDEVKMESLVPGDPICQVTEWPGSVPATVMYDLVAPDTIDLSKPAYETDVLIIGGGLMGSCTALYLAKRGVKVARFLPPGLTPPMLHINLRNHRKILITDGRVGFAGGMNIGDRHLADRTENRDRVIDAHFRIRGPVVNQLQRVFLDTWAFVNRSEVERFPSDDCEAGAAICRTIVEGPDEDLDKLLSVLLLAVSAAREQVAIMTPYFVPPRELVGALKGAALRGVDVVVIVPGRNNLPFVHWASRNMMWELLQRGVRFYMQPPLFFHTKLLMVDRH